MDADRARKLAEEGATIVCLDVPKGTEVGIDYKSWITDSNFSGIKMIPPGVHLLFFAAYGRFGDMAPRASFLLWLERRQVCAFRWDPSEELLVPVVEDGEQRQAEEAVRSWRLDSQLAPYPLEAAPRWRALSSCIEADDVRRLRPAGGSALLSTAAAADAGASAAADSPGGPDGALAAVAARDVEASVRGDRGLHFVRLAPDPVGDATLNRARERRRRRAPAAPEPTPPPGTDDSAPSAVDGDVDSADRSGAAAEDRGGPGRVPGGAARLFSVVEARGGDAAAAAARRAAEMTRAALDPSDSLVGAMRALGTRPGVLTAELQAAFAAFLLSQSLSAFTHWRRLVARLCRARALLSSPPPDMAGEPERMLRALRAQLEELPADFLEDSLGPAEGHHDSGSNFVQACVQSLCDVADEAEAERQTLAPGVARAIQDIVQFCASRLRLTVRRQKVGGTPNAPEDDQARLRELAERAAAGESVFLDDDGPVVVAM